MRVPRQRVRDEDDVVLVGRERAVGLVLDVDRADAAAQLKRQR